ncbi:MAG: [FeFe] hydrogenase H-cluster radical SAM maturase HydG, partial [Candidatus Micrarchaeota archaeon]
LLQTSDSEVIRKLFTAAKEVKEAIYGSRLVLFAPLYLSNYCVNNCLYCGFRQDNKALVRKMISTDELRKEVEALLDEGHKRLLLVAGEDPNLTGIDYFEKAIETVYSTKKGRGEIRRVNINVAPLSLEHFKRLKAAKIGTYQLFQETYHAETYKKMHPSGPKSKYFLRLNAIDLAQEAGIDDVGIGALFGLYDYRFEVLALLMHAEHLDKKYGTGPHTISVPRLEPALNAPLSDRPPRPVSDDDFKKLVAIIRLAVPYTGMILSTRESAQTRNEVFNLGISQISAGSRTTPGGYAEGTGNKFEEAQFAIHDTRTTSEVVKDICKMGFIPSFCTACYRSGRTGDYFMQFAKSGQIQNFCLPNALTTFKEYLVDYADSELKQLGGQVIAKEVEKIPDHKIREQTKERFRAIEKEGKRDLYL